MHRDGGVGGGGDAGPGTVGGSEESKPAPRKTWKLRELADHGLWVKSSLLPVFLHRLC